MSRESSLWVPLGILLLMLIPAMLRDRGEAGEGGGDRITLEDRKGEVFDFTDAVREDGFRPDRIHFGIGRGAIRSIDAPQVVHRGDRAFDTFSRDFPVMGVRSGSAARAYPIPLLSLLEVVNDVLGGAALAVAY